MEATLLQKFIKEEDGFLTNSERERIASKRFLKLFRKGNLLSRIFRVPSFTKEEVQSILANNNLIPEGVNPELLTEQALKGSYDAPDIFGEYYEFVECQDKKGQKIYSLQGRSYGL